VVGNTKTDRQLKKDTPGLAVVLREDNIFKKKCSVLQNVYTQFIEQTPPIDSKRMGVNNTT